MGGRVGGWLCWWVGHAGGWVGFGLKILSLPDLNEIRIRIKTNCAYQVTVFVTNSGFGDLSNIMILVKENMI